MKPDFKQIKEKLERGFKLLEEALVHFKIALDLRPDDITFKKDVENCTEKIKEAKEAINGCNIRLKEPAHD